MSMCHFVVCCCVCTQKPGTHVRIPDRCEFMQTDCVTDEREAGEGREGELGMDEE